MNLVAEQHDMLERIYCLPVVLRLQMAPSLLRLVRETGYEATSNLVTVEALRAGIAGRRGLVEAWLLYSREKDAAWGWYFEGPVKGTYRTGSRTRSLEMPIITADAEEACAYFIKAELEGILGRDLHTPPCGHPSS
jgi:hypothetical protein